MNGDEPRPEVQVGRLEHEPPQCWLRRSVPGEYLAMGLMFHAGFGAVTWGLAVWQSPSALGVVAAGTWIVGRAVGAFSGRWFTPPITVGLTLAVVATWQRGAPLPYATLVMFPPLVFVAMLGLVLAADLVELAPAWRSCSAAARLRRLNWYRLAVYGFAVLFVVYMILIPTVGWIIERMQPPKSSRVLEDMSLAEQVRLRSMEAMAMLWFFALGGTIGSFLNVVAYRMPRGESVAFQRSHCPRCGTQILGRDNIPIFGWLLLGGRCRECQASISIRYPVVETMTAALFLWLYFVELISGGANIPVRQPNSYHGVVWIVFYTKWDLVGLYLYHSFVLSVLATCVLLDIDRQRVSLRAKWCVASALFVPPLIWPDLLPVPVLAGASEWLPAPWLRAGVGCLVGGSCGAVLGRLTRWGIRPATSEEAFSVSHHHLTSGLVVIGMSLGWQATIAVTLFALSLRLVSATVPSLRRFSTSLTVCLLAAFVAHHTVWRWTFEYGSTWWPSHRTSAIGWVAVAAGYVALMLANQRVGSQPFDLALSARLPADAESNASKNITALTVSDAAQAQVTSTLDRG